LTRADVVVTSTGSKLPVIDRAMMRPVMKKRRQRPLFLVDIAVPRDVDPEVGKVEHVFLYNVDDLQTIVHDNMRTRAGEAERAIALVDEEVAAFLGWLRSRSLGPLIGELQTQGRKIVDAEVQRALKRLGELSDEQRAVVGDLGRVIMQKLLHRPMSNLRKAAGGSIGTLDGPVLAEALSVLFELDPSGAPAASEVSQALRSTAVTEAPVLPRPEPS
jgi:glutamyl-tRNA reductase